MAAACRTPQYVASYMLFRSPHHAHAHTHELIPSSTLMHVVYAVCASCAMRCVLPEVNGTFCTATRSVCCLHRGNGKTSLNSTRTPSAVCTVCFWVMWHLHCACKSAWLCFADYACPVLRALRVSRVCLFIRLGKVAMVCSTVSSKMLRAMAKHEGFYFEVCVADCQRL